MNSFQSSPSESIKQFINKYPLTVNYFQQSGLPEEGFESSLKEFSLHQGKSMEELDAELRRHMARVAQPEEDCSLPCFPGVCVERPPFWIGVGLLSLLILSLLYLL